MAVTNRQRIDDALGILCEALEPVVERTLDPLSNGLGWTRIIETLDEDKGRLVPDGGYNPSDLHVLLRATTSRLGSLGYPFKFSRTVTNYLNECFMLRNQHAHREQFSSDDTLRALDTVARVLKELGAPESARTIGKSRADLNRRVYAEQARSDARSAFSDLADEELTPWHEVLKPHPDVSSGRFKESEFAANLWSVANRAGDAGPEYTDPVQFFRRTYLTEGLTDLLRQSAGRISGSGNGSPVINLQTTFGGGKTHSMLAVWHLLGGVDPDDLPDEVGAVVRDSRINELDVARAAVVGNELPVGQETVKPDGTRVRTIWGEIAWQLGGRDGYELVAEADRTGTNPGAAMRELFASQSPCVILIDEWVAYARQLNDRNDLVGGTFDTQFTFAQTLTEAASQTPGALVLVSIPASDGRKDDDGTPLNDLETGGEDGVEAIKRLEHVVGRTAHQWQPASSVESFEIVRRRLFEEPDAEAARRIGATSRKFVDYYRANQGELPAHVREGAYEERINRAYPIHPELFDRLYEDWSTLERFQRTRGVLRLMSTVVKTLLDAGDKSPLIMPGSVPVGSPAVTSEFIQYVEPTWRAVIDTDVEGENSNAVAVDRERPVLGARHTTVRLARALFIASAATHSSAHKGVSAPDLFLGVAMPGDVLGNFHSGLGLLEDRSTYVFHDATHHWLDIAPSLNRTARDRANALDPADVEMALLKWLRTKTDDPGRLFQHVIVAPEDGAEVAENDETRLIVLGPQHTHSLKLRDSSAAVTAAIGMVTKRGQSGRSQRNTLVFLAPDEQKVEVLRSAVRDHLAWKSIVDETEKLDLRHEQAQTARRRMDEEANRIENQIPEVWIWTIAPRQNNGTDPQITGGPSKTDTKEKRLAVRAAKKFVDNGDLYDSTYAPKLIRVNLERYIFSVWNQGHISLGRLWEFHASYLYLARLRSRTVLITGVESVLSDSAAAIDGFWLAESYDEATGHYSGLLEPGVDLYTDYRVDDTTLLVRPEIARQQRARDATAAAEATSPEDHIDTATGTSASEIPSRTSSENEHSRSDADSRTAIANTIFRARHQLDPAGDISGELQTIAEEVIENLLAGSPDALDITISISARRAEGFDDRTVRNVNENARTLDITESAFEDR